MSSAEKDTIYIDIDDEITAIIDKVQASNSKIVALVLPKRATVLQSVVNMKLLKRAADNADKNLVLITSEAGLMPLAGAAGVYVAKNLQTKPEVPQPPDETVPADEPAEDVPESSEAETGEIDATQTVGELATKSTTQQPEETIEVDNDAPVEDAAGAGVAAGKAKKAKNKKDKKNKIPNFDQFRKRLFLIGGGIIALIVLCIFAFFVLPKAKVTIKTDTSSKDTQVNFTASASAQSVDESNSVVPSKVAQSPKSDSQSAPATGKKDVGSKASGTVTMTAKNCTGLSTPASVPAGTVLTVNNIGFTTSSAASFSFESISGGCINFKSGSVGITAQNSGEGSNVGSATFAVAGRSDVSATGSASGGTSKVVTVVSQSDVDAAKAKLSNTDEAAKQQLKKNLEDQGYLALTDTFTLKDAAVTVSPDVDQEGSQVTVTSKGTYQMIGVKEDDLKKVIDKSMSSEIDSNKQQIQDYGFKDAKYKVVKTEGNGDTSLTISTQLAVGPKIDENQLKNDIAGKKKGDTENTIKEIPGVKDVEVSYSPFWVSKTPKKTSKITIVLQKAN